MKSIKIMMAISIIGIITCLFFACQKDNEMYNLVTQQQHLRSENLVFDNPTSSNPILIRTIENDWYLVDECKVYKRHKPTQKWQFVAEVCGAIKTELQAAIQTYEANHPDDLSLPEPPADAVAAYAFSDKLYGTITTHDGEWYSLEPTPNGEYGYRRITKPMPCPRACEKSDFSVLY